MPFATYEDPWARLHLRLAEAWSRQQVRAARAFANFSPNRARGGQCSSRRLQASSCFLSLAARRAAAACTRFPTNTEAATCLVLPVLRSSPAAAPNGCIELTRPRRPATHWFLARVSCLGCVGASETWPCSLCGALAPVRPNARQCQDHICAAPMPGAQPKTRR